MSSLKPPEKINLTSQTGNVSELWRKFKRELKHYMIATGIAFTGGTPVVRSTLPLELLA